MNIDKQILSNKGKLMRIRSYKLAGVYWLEVARFSESQDRWTDFKESCHPDKAKMRKLVEKCEYYLQNDIIW